ncbi:FG-GAP-like repeat-containing protein [Kitasatospora griseola]|uniref:FG-GAP-like repeat-containing protein n=1 Tax=Kitasatospora griseola TaxID=2064 RepID=UPI003813FB38
MSDFSFLGGILRKVQRAALLVAALLIVPGAVVAVPASATEAAAPLAVETFSYPDAARILAERNITLKAGDGNIRLAECTSETNLLRVSSAVEPKEVCFKVSAATGYLAMEIPRAFLVWNDGNQAVKATVSTGGTISSVDLAKNHWTSVGEGVETGATPTALLELTATGGAPTSNPSPQFPAVGSIAVGAPGHANSRGCTGTLIGPLWVLTSLGCFTDTPAALPAGAPATKSTFTAGGRSTDLVELVPRADRDVVLARLAAPIYEITPVTLAAAVPANAASVKVAGFGRTATAWGTGNGPRTTAQNVGTISATGMDLALSNGAAPVCAGDSGAPVLDTAGKLAGVVSRAWQAGCAGTPASETRTGAQAARTDDLGTWIKPLLQRPANAANEAGGSGKVRWADFDGDHRPDYFLIADNGEVKTYLNHGGEPAGPAGWQPVGTIAKGLTPDRSRARFADFDGDGKADYLQIKEDGSITVYLNRGGDPAGTNGWQSLGTVARGATLNQDQVRFADFDGDGKTDYCVIADTGEVTVFLNRGGDQPGVDGWQSIGKVAKGTSDRSRVRLADFDGDGKADYWLINANGNVQTYLNRGGDTAGTNGWQDLGTVALGVTPDQTRVQFVDFTADSHADYMYAGANGATSVAAWANNGGNVPDEGGWIDLGTVATGA